LTVEESQRVAWFSEFERSGELAVRLSVGCGEWENSRSKLAAAEEWLRLKDEERALAASAIRDAREEKTLRLAWWANAIAIAAAIIAIIAIVMAKS